MTLKEAEANYGKPWRQWTRAEARAFVAALSFEDATAPEAAALALEHPDVMRHDMKNFIKFLELRKTGTV